jgi:predicted deacetylase
MKITIRMDDITPDMDWEKFERFKAVLDKHNVRPLIGVVPFNKDEKLRINPPREDFWEYIKSLQQMGWVVAMHGYNHLYTTKKAGIFPIGNKSEFAGLSYSAQDEMIREGKRILKANGIVTDFFMAPSHSYDRNTLKALKKNGFYRVTDGFGRAPYEVDGIIFYPISVSKGRTLEDKKEGIVSFVYHTNTMSDKDFENFEKIFTRADVVSFNEFMHYGSDFRGFRAEIGEYILAKAKYTAVQLRKKRKK